MEFLYTMLYISCTHFKTQYTVQPYDGHEVFQTSMDTVGPYSLDCQYQGSDVILVNFWGKVHGLSLP